MTSIDTLREQLWDDDWTFVFPRLDEKHMINTFDDGNEKYNMYYNEWIIFGEWKEKKALFNYHNQDIIIKSISSWKLTKI